MIILFQDNPFFSTPLTMFPALVAEYSLGSVRVVEHRQVDGLLAAPIYPSTMGRVPSIHVSREQLDTTITGLDEAGFPTD